MVIGKLALSVGLNKRAKRIVLLTAVARKWSHKQCGRTIDFDELNIKCKLSKTAKPLPVGDWLSPYIVPDERWRSLMSTSTPERFRDRLIEVLPSWVRYDNDTILGRDIDYVLSAVNT